MPHFSSRLLHCAAVPALLVASPVVTQSPARDAALQEVVRAERGFAAMSRKKGLREAFLANLAEDGLVFRPGPVNGRSAYVGRKPGPELLTWKPSSKELCRPGDERVRGERLVQERDFTLRRLVLM